LALSTIAGSISSLLQSVIIAELLIVYLKKIEEKELEMRFGQVYTKYKAKTPFMIARLTAKKKGG